MSKRKNRGPEGRLCDTCGNPVPWNAVTCSYCAHPLSATSFMAGGTRGIPVLNLEEGLPGVEEARRRLVDEIARIRSGRRPQLLRVVHGWGSGGTGGAIKDMVRRTLAVMATRGEISGFVRGEELGRHTDAGRRLLARAPDLAAVLGNPGITVVEL